MDGAGTMGDVRLGRDGRRALVLLGLGLAATGSAWAGGGVHVVSQSGRDFQPHEIAISRGDTLEIVNDDADLIHHAYVDSSSFSFDSGDQQPGSKTDVVFTKAGDFTVLCGIHPKMKMQVKVRD